MLISMWNKCGHSNKEPVEKGFLFSKLISFERGVETARRRALARILKGETDKARIVRYDNDKQVLRHKGSREVTLPKNCNNNNDNRIRLVTQMKTTTIKPKNKIDNFKK